MPELVGDINGIPLYSDQFVEENTMLKGRKEGSGTSFIIMHPNTAKKIVKGLLVLDRKEKLIKINKDA